MPRDSARDARRLLRPLREETLALAQALVRVDTVATPPDGHETAAQERLASAFRRHGIDVEPGGADGACPSRPACGSYFQFLPHEDVGARVAEIEASLRDFAAADPFFRKHPLEVRRLVDPPLEGHELAADHPWTRCLHGAARGVLGPAVPLTASEWPCDAFLNHVVRSATPAGDPENASPAAVAVRQGALTLPTYEEDPPDVKPRFDLFARRLEGR